MFIDDLNAEPTAYDGLLIFLQFKKMKKTPTKTNKSTKVDRAMIIMVLRFIIWFLFMTIAVNGSVLAFPLGLLPASLPCGGGDGIPATNCLSLNKKHNSTVK